MKLIGKKEFAEAILDLKYKVFVVHVAALNISSNIGVKVHLSKKPQIAHLKANKVLTEVPSKYADFANVFLPKLTIKFSKHIDIHNHTIELVDG